MIVSVLTVYRRVWWKIDAAGYEKYKYSVFRQSDIV